MGANQLQAPGRARENEAAKVPTLRPVGVETDAHTTGQHLPPPAAGKAGASP